MKGLKLKTGYLILLLDANAKIDEAIAAGAFYKIIRDSETLKVNSTDLVLTDAFAAVATGAESGFKDHDKLEPREDPPELYFVRWGIQDGCDYHLKLPSGTERLGVYQKKDIGKITALDSDHLTPAEDYGFWMIHGDFPSYNAKNKTGYTITPCVYFEGEKYNIEKISDPTLLQELREGKQAYTVVERGGILG